MSDIQNEDNLEEKGIQEAGPTDESVEDSIFVTKKKRQNTTQQLKDEIEEQNERLLRVMADYDNYRKRTEKERQSLVSLGTAYALEKILPVMDTLEIAATAESIDSEYKKGVELTLSMFANAIKSLGITEIDALNQPFDPNIHNCISTVESEDTDSGTVTAVLQKGYRYGDRIIRPAGVTVAQ